MNRVGLLGGLGQLALAVIAAVGLSSTGRAAEAADRSAPPSHCRAQEQILYSCRFGRRIGSVCASDGAVHYRFGPADEPEFDLASTSDWSNVHVGYVIGQGGGHQSHVRFTRGRYHYIVFEGVDGSLAERPGRRYSGIYVGAGDDGSQQLAHLECRTGHVPDRLSHAVDALAPPTVGEELWERENGPFDAWY